MEEPLTEHQREAEFESTFTHTLYFLAQVEEGLGNSEHSAKYCHTTLLRQLETKQYDPVDWALNCATLSQYYITKDNYPMARHCLGWLTGPSSFLNIYFWLIFGACKFMLKLPLKHLDII